jgi:hypothetical protein
MRVYPLLVFLFVSLASFSQTLVKGELPEDFLKNWREKVFILTDRGYYNSGDTIWLKALFKYSNPSYQDSLSKVLHVDLYTPSKKLVSKSKFKIRKGLVASGIGIPDQLPPDTYFLVAYTSWMLNFGEYFIKPLPIGEIGKYGKANPADTISGVPEGLKIKVDLPDYINPRENVTLKIKAITFGDGENYGGILLRSVVKLYGGSEQSSGFNETTN